MASKRTTHEHIKKAYANVYSHAKHTNKALRLVWYAFLAWHVCKVY